MFGAGACTSDESELEGDETNQIVQGLSMQNAQAVAALSTNGATSLGGTIHLVGAVPTLPPTTFDLYLEPKAQWSGVEITDLAWDADKVRQGQTLEVGRTGSATGVLLVTWNLSGSVNPLQLGAIDIGNNPIAADATPCNPKLSNGDEYQCSVDSPKIPIIPYVPVPGAPYVDFNVGVTFTIDGDTATTTRTLMLGDEEADSDELAIADTQSSEQLPMPCGKPAGTTVDYVLDPVSWTPSSLKVTQQPQFTVGWTILVPAPIPFPAGVDLFTGPLGDPVVSNPTLTLEGAGSTVSFGELQANNVNPTVQSAGPFSGTEGTPVAFSAATTSACPITSYVWNFSNGTTSYGPSPLRTFGDDGVFDGQLTVTDMTGLSGTGSFTATITNKPPVAEAGPATSGAWGTPIAFNGQAVDPGADDQSTLTYEWNWGDGTPGTGGASATHAYALPGNYTATLKVCDDHGCVTDSAAVTVRKRNTVVSYTGTNVGTYSASSTLAGSVVDEFGLPVVNASLVFTVAGADAGAANTNAAGNGSRVNTIGLNAGSYGVGVAYAGNGLYNGGASAEEFAVSAMATAVSYTGSLKGGANKVVNLSAKLVDALDRPLAGKLVSFTLGTQSASATTDANGIATTSLKLAQKNGQYQLTTSYAGNTVQWTGASASKTFSIGGK